MKKKCLLFVTTLFVLLILLSACSGKTKADEIIEAGPDKSLSINNISFSVEDMDSCKEVKPEDPSGYYHYYEEQEGYYYYVISGKVVNKGAYAFDAENIKIQGVNDSTSYDGRLLFSNPEESEFIKEIRMNEELKFYFIILIKDGAPPPDKINIFYTKDFKVPQEDQPYDTLLTWTLPSF